MSGMGLDWDDYGDAIKQDITDAVFELMTSHLKAQLGDDEDSLWDDTWEDLALIQSSLEQALYLLIAEMKTADAWRHHAGSVMADIEVEKRRRGELKHKNHTLSESMMDF